MLKAARTIYCYLIPEPHARQTKKNYSKNSRRPRVLSL